MPILLIILHTITLNGWAVGLSTIFVDPAPKPASFHRLQQAREILGKKFHHSPVRKTERLVNLDLFVHTATQKFLPKSYQKQSRSISNAILEAAKTHDFDPIFLMAMIQNESSFNPRSTASMGEIGLLQIKPSIAQWIAPLYQIKYSGPADLLNPSKNIRIGAAFLAHLRKQFARQIKPFGPVYIAAYNMGPKNVRYWLAQSVRPSIYLEAIQKRYLAFYAALAERGTLQKRAELAWNRFRQNSRSINSVQ